jgi:hypothetical protein
MGGFILFLAWAGGIIGLLESTQAAVGVAIVACACIAAITARIVQASDHQKALLSALAKSSSGVTASPPAETIATDEDGRITCWSCGAHVLAWRKLCHNCGANVRQPAPQA